MLRLFQESVFKQRKAELFLSENINIFYCDYLCYNHNKIHDPRYKKQSIYNTNGWGRRLLASILFITPNHSAGATHPSFSSKFHVIKSPPDLIMVCRKTESHCWSNLSLRPWETVALNFTSSIGILFRKNLSKVVTPFDNFPSGNPKSLSFRTGSRRMSCESFSVSTRHTKHFHNLSGYFWCSNCIRTFNKTDGVMIFFSCYSFFLFKNKSIWQQRQFFVFSKLIKLNRTPWLWIWVV